jgi:hypothetical protein
LLVDLLDVARLVRLLAIDFDGPVSSTEGSSVAFLFLSLFASTLTGASLGCNISLFPLGIPPATSA